jgi:hypothetical protein
MNKRQKLNQIAKELLDISLQEEEQTPEKIYYENLKNLQEKNSVFEEKKNKEEIQILQKENQILNTKINEMSKTLTTLTSINSKNTNKKKKKVLNYQDYLGFEAKAYKRSFEVYEIVIQYFTFMLKNFDNRLMREIVNELFVQYGEDLIPNSFDIYCQFQLQNENLRDQKTLKEKMLQEREREERNQKN